jgi:hypothetical protein
MARVVRMEGEENQGLWHIYREGVRCEQTAWPLPPYKKVPLAVFSGPACWEVPRSAIKSRSTDVRVCVCVVGQVRARRIDISDYTGSIYSMAIAIAGVTPIGPASAWW